MGLDSDKLVFILLRFILKKCSKYCFWYLNEYIIKARLITLLARFE